MTRDKSDGNECIMTYVKIRDTAKLIVANTPEIVLYSYNQ